MLVPLFELHAEQATFLMKHHFLFERLTDRTTVAIHTWVLATQFLENKVNLSLQVKQLTVFVPNDKI